MTSFLRQATYHLGYIIYYKLNYPKLLKEYKLIKKNLSKSINENLEIQRRRLYDLILYAINFIPYYRKIAKEREIIISKDTIIQDISKFPILTKEIIRDNWEDLHSDLDKIEYIINTSGGTTGEPTKIIQDIPYTIKGEAITLIFDEIGGYKVGEKLIRLWGSEKELQQLTTGLLNRIKNRFIKNTQFLNAFKMTEKDIFQYISIINSFKPKVIIAYVQSIMELAKFIKKFHLQIIPIPTIITSAGILTEESKNYIEGVFNCKVFNRYGSREIGMIATSCEYEDELHINTYHQYVEILDENGAPLEEHQKGNIIITSLINYGMPLIRFKIGDRGSLNLTPCSCGRGLPRLENVYGRTVDVFKNKYGDLIDGEYFTHLFYTVENVKQFQVIQESYTTIFVNLITIDNQRLSPLSEANIKEKIQHVMGKECNVIFNYVLKIDPTSSGKMRFTISKLQNDS